MFTANRRKYVCQASFSVLANDKHAWFGEKVRNGPSNADNFKTSHSSARPDARDMPAPCLSFNQVTLAVHRPRWGWVQNPKLLKGAHDPLIWNSSETKTKTLFNITS